MGRVLPTGIEVSVGGVEQDGDGPGANGERGMFTQGDSGRRVRLSESLDTRQGSEGSAC